MSVSLPWGYISLVAGTTFPFLPHVGLTRFPKMHSEDALEQCDGVPAGKFAIGFGQKYVVLPHDEGALRSINRASPPVPGYSGDQSMASLALCGRNRTPAVSGIDRLL